MWLALCAAPSGYLVAIALLGTLAVKLLGLPAIAGARGDAWSKLIVSVPDATLLGGMGALLVAGEGVARKAASRPLLAIISGFAIFIFVFALFNGAYLAVTGDQLTASIIAMGWERLHDASGILLEELRHHRLTIALFVIGVVAVPFVARFWLHRTKATGPTPNAALPFALLSACAGLCWLLLPSPSSLPLARLARSALLTTYVTWFQNSMQAMLEGGDADVLTFEPLLEPGSTQNPSSRYNVIIVGIESLRHDYTSLNQHPKMQTPNIAALAQRGAASDAVSTPLPHTTKALFAAHCGQMPFWQSEPREMSTSVQIQCLPSVLHAAGYATGFFQTAIGAFEDRPRLVDRLGFEHFEAWENIGGEPVGYLASDDLSLAPALDRWLDTLPADRPFLATLLTSATHHPYRLPKGELERLQAAGIDPSALTSEERYAKLVVTADALIGKLDELVARRGLRERTLIVVFGDHGEGFGEKGVRQHDNNYYQESLRIPLVIAGPGVPVQRLPDDVSLLDVAPTLLDLLGFQAAARDPELYGRNALVAWPGPRTKYFSCFYDGVCFGYIRGHTKIVVLPELQRAIRFDLDQDPNETKAVPVDDSAEGLKQLGYVARKLQQSAREPIESADLRMTNGWVCPKDGMCGHPKTPPGLFFTPTTPDQCLKGKINVADNEGAFDLTLHMHNVCSGSMVCELVVESEKKQSVMLRPDQVIDVVLQRAGKARRIDYAVTCDFL